MAQDSSLSSIPLGKAVEEFLGSNGATATMRVELSRWLVLCGRECPMFTLASTEVTEYVSEVKKPAERRKRVEALVAFFEYAKGNGWMRTNLAAGLVQKKEAPRKKAAANTARKPIELSEDGRQIIESEIKRLSEEKVRTIEEVKDARADGDLRENAPYHAAREKLAMIEAQIREYRDMLMRAVS